MNRKLWRLLTAGLCLCLLLAGCASKASLEDIRASISETLGGTDPTKTPGVTAEPTDPPSSGKDHSKYNAYIDLGDEMAEMEKVLEVYFENVAYQADFELKDGGDYANLKPAAQYFTAMTYTAKKALDYADEAPSYPEVDEAVTALGDSVETVMSTLEALGRYVRLEKFKEDGLAQAAKLHAKLWTALETYDQHYQQFLTALGELIAEREEQDLADLLEGDQMILYHSRLFIREAQAIQDESVAQLNAAIEENPELEDFPPLDMDPFAAPIIRFQNAYDDLTAALADEEQLGKVRAFTGQVGDGSLGLHTDKEAALELYTSRVEDLYVKTENFVQAMREGTDYAGAYREAEEAAGEMIRAYNDLI